MKVASPLNCVRLVLLTMLLSHGAAFSRALAADSDPAQVEVSADRNSLGMDESLSLRFSIRVEGTAQVGDPEYNAPDFDEVNQYSSVFVESFYENGKFGVRNNRKITKILRPRKTGSLTISDIRVRVNGKSYDQRPIQVQVVGSGQGTPPPARYGGSGMGLRGVGKNTPQLPFTIRVELDRTRAYKGQQVIVSYYLYRRSKVFNIQVQKYPILDGFLREDIDLPILGQRLESESVVVDGVPFERSLLARYAAYPLKEGKLPIDSMTIKGNYYPGSDAGIDMNNPLQGFFQQLQPKEWSHRNDRIELEVVPLPTDGRPTSFTGGVGDFVLESALDKRNLKVNDAATLTIKVEGTGNVAAITEPKVSWPKDVEVFESKSRMLPARGGVSTKIFEIVFIPRRPGKVTIPAAEMAYFSVKDSAYRVLRGADQEIEVVATEGVQASVPNAQSTPRKEGAVFLLPEEWKNGIQLSGQSSRIVTVLLWLILVLSGLLVGGVLFRRVAKKWTRLRSMQASWFSGNRARGSDSGWGELRRFEEMCGQAPWSEVLGAYEQLLSLFLSEVESCSQIPARALSRDDLFREAIEKGGEEGVWKRVCVLLEYCEWVRYGSSAGMVTQPEARSRFPSWMGEAGRLIAELKKASS
jgi:BatD DUF11 like domain